MRIRVPAGLALLYGDAVPEASLGTLLGLASAGVLVAVLSIAWMVLRSHG